MQAATRARSVIVVLLLGCTPAVVGCDDNPTAPSRMYSLTAQTSPSGSGSITKSPNQSQFTSGASVTLTATSASGYSFTGWQGDASGSTNPITVKMDRNKTVTALFAPIPPNQYTLTVSASPSEAGTIARAPDQQQYAAGTTVTLTATAAPGHQFTGWQGDADGSTNGIAVTMDRNKAVTAVFAPVGPMYTVTVSASPGEAGTIARAPDQPQYAAGTAVTLTATAGAGYQFTGWQGDASGSTNPISITVNANRTITGAFVRVSTSFVNDTQDAMSIVSLKVDGEERLRSPEEVRPEKALEISVTPGPHHYETVHGYFDGSGRHDLYTRAGSYTQVLGTQLVKVSGRMIEDLLSPYYWIEECSPQSGDKYAYRFYSDRRFEHYKNRTVLFAGAYDFVRTSEFVRTVQFALNGNPNPFDWITLDPLEDSFWASSSCPESESGVGQYKRSVTPSITLTSPALESRIRPGDPLRLRLRLRMSF